MCRFLWIFWITGTDALTHHWSFPHLPWTRRRSPSSGGQAENWTNKYQKWWANILETNKSVTPEKKNLTWKGTVSKRKGKIVFQFHHLFRGHLFVFRSGHQKWWALEHRGWDEWRTIHRNIILIQPLSSTTGMTWWYKNSSICHETFQLATQQKAKKRHVYHIFNCRPSLKESQS